MPSKTDEKGKKGNLSVVGERGAEIEIDAETGEVNGTGKTLEEIAEQAQDETPGFIKGTSTQLSLDVGGKQPTGSDLKIKERSLPIQGQFPKNKRISFLVEVEVETINFKTVRDKDGFIVGHDRIHLAEVRGIQRA